MNMAAWPGRTHRYLQEPALYPFGYGLSYTSFEYGKPLLKPASSSNGEAAIQVSIRNSGGLRHTHHGWSWSFVLQIGQVSAV